MYCRRAYRPSSFHAYRRGWWKKPSPSGAYRWSPRHPPW
ncbi:hypothetical protein ACP70R_024148 [Stipagrostis hirtigluma subsp. patula]